MIGLALLVAGGAGVAAWVLVGEQPPVAAGLVVHMTATLVLFGFSFWFKNTCFYDPMWSLGTVILIAVWTTSPDSVGLGTMRALVALALVVIWGVRMKVNWVRRWDGIQDEDWRYEQMRERFGRWYWLIDLFGLHISQTLMVFAASTPMIAVVVAPRNEFGGLDAVAICVTAAAIAIEATADRQLAGHAADPTKHGKAIESGLWAYSRHPNYFGQMSFWWGLFLFGLAANPAYWWTIVGPLTITALFVFISVPMMDKRSLERRPEYAEVMKRVPALVPWKLPRRPGK